MANVLMVDDNRDLCQVVQTALERDGHRVETRLSGAELTEQLCRWADCILLDVMMPGEDGFAVCRRIRGLTDAPILFLTARTDEASVLEGLGIGADDYIAKPFRVAELRARVAAHLRRQNRTPVRGGTHSVCTTSTSSPSPGYCHATSSYSAGWAFQYHAGTDLTILFQHDHLPLRARRASVQRSSGIRPIPNGNRLHAPARKSAGPRRSRRSPRYPQMLPVVSCYFFLFEPR